MSAYQAGRISRRTFVRGMAALGLSVSVATALAESIEAAPASGGGRGVVRAVGMPDDTYEPHPAPAQSSSEVAEVTTLPATGVGESRESGSGLLKTGMLAGAAALIAGGYRKLKDAAAEDDAK